MIGVTGSVNCFIIFNTIHIPLQSVSHTNSSNGQRSSYPSGSHPTHPYVLDGDEGKPAVVLVESKIT